MTDEGRPVITALESRMFRILPQLRSKSYSRYTALTLPQVVLAWWRYAYINVVIELKQREELLDKCSTGGDSINITGRTKTRLTSGRAWDWREQSKIRKEYIELYLLVHGTPTGEHVARSTAESRLVQLEEGLNIERILLLRNVSRAASLSTDESRASLFHNFTSCNREAQLEGIGSASTQTKQTSTTARENEPLRTDTGAAVSQNTSTDSTHTNPLSFCTSVLVSGFSIALCELHHVKKKKDLKCDDDTPDDISALTGFSESIDSSLQQASQQTTNDRFDPMLEFWINDQRKWRYEPILLMHVSDLEIGSQKAIHVRSKHRILAGGVVLQGGVDAASKVILSIGHVPGLLTHTKEHVVPHSEPCISSLTMIDATSPASTFIDLRSSSLINIDWEWVKNTVFFLSVNTDIKWRSYLPPLYKEDNLRRVVTKPKLKSLMPLSVEWKAITVNIPVPESDIVVLTLNLQIRKGIDSESNEHHVSHERDDNAVVSLRCRHCTFASQFVHIFAFFVSFFLLTTLVH
jgi:hypothetical protein